MGCGRAEEQGQCKGEQIVQVHAQLYVYMQTKAS